MGPHGVHNVAPDVALKKPAMHAWQEVLPDPLGEEKKPAAQGVAVGVGVVAHVLAPAGDVKPVSHIKHAVIPEVAVGDVTL